MSYSSVTYLLFLMICPFIEALKLDLAWIGVISVFELM